MLEPILKIHIKNYSVYWRNLTPYQKFSCHYCARFYNLEIMREKRIGILRIILVGYVIYKMFLVLFFPKILLTNLEEKSAGEITGGLLVLLLFIVIFILYFIYQLKCIIVELNGKYSDGKNNRLRLFSIFFSIAFFTLSAVSLFNVRLEDVTLTMYLAEFYTVFTVIAVVSSAFVGKRDILNYREFKKANRSYNSLSTK